MTLFIGGPLDGQDKEGYTGFFVQVPMEVPDPVTDEYSEDPLIKSYQLFNYKKDSLRIDGWGYYFYRSCNDSDDKAVFWRVLELILEKEKQ
jgi:hypothetical protein